MRIYVKVITKARQNSVVKKDDVFVVRTTAAPANGQANRAVIALLATHFGVAKSCVDIVQGKTTKHKIVDIEKR